MALRKMRTASLLDALDNLDLLAEVKSEKLEPAAVCWHGRVEIRRDSSSAVASSPADTRSGRALKGRQVVKRALTTYEPSAANESRRLMSALQGRTITARSQPYPSWL
jgi:hypothetical protein